MPEERLAKGARRPISRDLTVKFHQLRSDKQYSQQQGDTIQNRTQPLLDTASPGGGAGGGDREFVRASLPPQWVDHSEEAQETIKLIRDRLEKLTKAQQRRLRAVFRSDDAPDGEVEQLSNDIAMLIRRCEQAIYEVKHAVAGAARAGGGSLQEEEDVRLNMQRSLAKQLQEVSKQCREAQREYLEEVRRRQRQQQGLPPDSDGGGAGGGISSPARGARGGLLELDSMEEFAGQRSAEICQIATSVNELNGIFKELAALVIDQGTILDRIDFNVEQVQVKGQKANEHLQKAHKTKKAKDSRAFKCMLIMAAFNALMILILIIKYKIKYGWSASQVMWFLFILGSSIGACGYICWYKPPWCPLSQKIPSIWPQFEKFDIKAQAKGCVAFVAQRLGYSAPIAQGIAHAGAQGV